MQGVGCRVLDVDTEAPCQEGCTGWGSRRGCRREGRQGQGRQGLLPAVPYCSWPAEEDLVLPTRCSSEPNEEQDLNKRKGAGGEEIRLWGWFHQMVSLLQLDTDTLCALSRGNKITGFCS